MLLLKKEILALEKLLKGEIHPEVAEILDNILENSSAYGKDVVFSVLGLKSAKNLKNILMELSSRKYKSNKDIENIEKALTLEYLTQTIKKN